MSDRILYIIHRRHWTSTRIADVLAAIVYEIEFLCYADVVIAGGCEGSMRQPERWPWLIREMAWAHKVVERGDRPILGMCLGA